MLCFSRRFLDLVALRNDSVEMSAALEPILRSSWQATAGASALAGVLSHHIVFRPYEIDGAAWDLVFTFIGLFILLCIAYAQISGFAFFASLCRTLLVATTYNVSLTVSILVYRAFFHRLQPFPGPFNARLLRFYAFHKATKTIRGCEDIQKLHEKYGDFVRVGTKRTPPPLQTAAHRIGALVMKVIWAIGPREISINRSSAIRPIYEPPTKTTRSPWYAQVSNDVTKISLNSTRVLQVHKQRKKGWERGLGSRGKTCQTNWIRET